MNIRKIGVIGAGTMGHGIAQACAVGGLDVAMIDIHEAAVLHGLAAIATSLDRLVKKDRLAAADKEGALGRIHGTSDYDALRDCDLIVEAATENERVKNDILKEADARARPGSILASNTSSISITKLAAATSRPDRFVGIHFFNPVPMMALVEVVVGKETSDATVAAARAYAQAVGKTPITVTDSPGFVVNRILFPMINEAANAYHENVATAEDIDTGMKLGANWPMGPLALADLVGLDTTSAILETLERELGDAKYKPSPALTRLRDAGKLGRKTGSGFYDYGK